MERSIVWMRVAALFALIGVALGAIGAHALKDQLVTNGSVETWKTAALYQMVHALAILVVAAVAYRKTVCLLFVAGIVLFSGSLYGLALTKWSVLGPITPLGGVCFLVGWGLLAWRPQP